MADERLGASFSIDVTQLKAGLAQANRLIRESKSEFKAAAAGMDDWSKSEEGLKAKLTSLNQIASIQTTAVNALQNEYDRLVEEGLDPSSAQAVKLRTEINEQRAALNKTLQEIKKYTGQLEGQTQATSNASEETEELDDNVEEAGEAAKEASKGFTVMKGALASLVADGIRKCVGALKEFTSGTIEAGIAFDSSMSNVAALSGATGEELEMLRETAKRYGEQTKFSASEAADALSYMALAGWDAEQSASSLGGVLNLAAASNMELAQASDMVTDYLSAFSLEAKDSAYFADLLAYAQAHANTTAAGLGEAFKNSAANMNAAGQDIETTVALLSMMANQGLKGSEAGTALTAVMRDLTAKMENGAISIGKTSVAVMDANGNYRDLTDILKDVENATNGMGDAERASALSTTFTADSIKGLNLMLNAGIDSAADFETQLRNSSGAAEEMAEIMQDNLQGDLLKLNSAFEGLQLTIFETANGSMREVVQSVTNDLIPAITDFVNGVEGSGARVGEAVAKIVNNILTTIIQAAPQIVEMGFALIANLIKGILSSLPDIVKAGTTIIVNLVKGIGDTIPQLVKQIIEIVPLIIEVFADAIPELIDGAVNFLMAIVTAIPQIVSALQKALPKIYKTIINGLVNAIPQLIKAAVTMLRAIVDAIPQILPLLTSTLPEIIKTIIGSLNSWLPDLIDGAVTLLMAIVDAVPLIIPPLISALPDIINTIIKEVLSAIPILLDAAVTLLMALIDAIPTIISQLSSNIPDIVQTIVEILLANFPVLLDGAIRLFMALVAAIPQIIIALAGALPEIITTVINTLIEPLFAVFKGLWEGIKNGVSALWHNITNAFSAAPTWFYNTVIQPLANYFGGMWDNLKKGAANAWTGIKNVFGTVAKFFRDTFSKAWTAVKNVFSTGGKVFDGIKEGIVNAFKAVVNVIIRGINKVIAVPLNGLNAVLDKIQNVSFLGISPFSWVSWRAPIPQIPELAQGGVVKKATTAVVGEAGEEAIVPLENNTQWIKKVAQEIAAEQQPNVTINQTNNYSQAHSRYEIYKSKQQTAAAVRLALAGV